MFSQATYELDSCMSPKFRSNKELNYKLAALEVFLPNRNVFAFVASLKIYCTSRRLNLHTSFWVPCEQSLLRSSHREPAQSVCVADCYFIVNVLDLPFASPIAICR